MVDDRLGVIAALEIRRESFARRLVLMTIIAILIGTVGRWPLAGAWWAAYVFVQALSLIVEARVARWGCGPVYVLSFISFAIAGAPAWHLWTQDGVLGVSACTMFLVGMLAQLVASSLAARALFLASAAPLFSYMVVVPAVYFGSSHPREMMAAIACPGLLAAYLASVWRGQQRILHTIELSRQAADAATRAKSEFLALMSHEIRTPLNAVMGAAELLERTELTAEQRSFATMLRQGGVLLMRVLNDVLDFSKIEAGRLSIEAATTDLHDLVHRCAAFWQPGAMEKGLELRVVVDPAAPRLARLDAVRTEQILFNLLSNAVKFTDRGGITVELRPADRGEGAGVVLSVADTGIGMSGEAAGRLFEPFAQADGSITRRFGGTGLGLAISQRLAGLMGGSIVVESAAGAGSSFRLTLPVGAADDAEAPAADSDATEDLGSTPLRILVAEDNAANRTIIDHFLRAIDAEVTMVTNGLEAVEAVQAQAFDVVLMDVQMPVMDGMEATRRIRGSAGPNADTPIIALTADALDAQREQCRVAGMNGHVSKPIDLRLLLAAVAAAASGRPPHRDAASQTAA